MEDIYEMSEPMLDPRGLALANSVTSKAHCDTCASLTPAKKAVES